MEKVYLGIDIGGTNTKYGFINESGEVLSSHKVATNSGIDFNLYAKELARDVDSNFQFHKMNYQLEAVGVGAPNANGSNGFIENPPNLAWDRVNLVKEFEEAFKLPVKVENDANIAAVGEKKFGRAKDLDNFIVITLGTGVGTGTYINGKLYLGSHGVGSEAGHLIVNPGGRKCGCGGLGHLECYASATGIEMSAAEKLKTELCFREINDKFHSKVAEYVELIDEAAKYLAMGLSSMSSLLSPQVFILSGGVCALGDEFTKLVQEHYLSFVYKPFRDNTKIVISDISTEYGAILGAASLVM